MTIGLIGLGLIGGSLARALTARTGHRVVGWDRAAAVREAALAAGAISGLLAPEQMGTCDLVVVAVKPATTREVLQAVAAHLSPRTILLDCCGVKRGICEEGEALAAGYGFTFIGGHPMAGREYGGFEASLPTLFDGASMILVASGSVTTAVREQVTGLCREIGFGRVVFTTAAHHDRMIALTSQLAHVVSSAYVKHPLAEEHRGYSAGSFADMTRVARLDAALWGELLLENSDFLVEDIDRLVAALLLYREALAAGDADGLEQLLREGRECKERL